MADHFTTRLDVPSDRLSLSGVLPDDDADGELRHALLVGLAGVRRELVVDLGAVTLIPAAARRELAFLVLVAQHFDKSVRFETPPGTAAALVLPAMGLPVHVLRDAGAVLAQGHRDDRDRYPDTA